MFMAKQKMSVYLIKEGFNIGDVVDSNDPYIHRHLLEDGSVVYTKPSDPHPPKWIDYFDGNWSPILCCLLLQALSIWFKLP